MEHYLSRRKYANAQGKFEEILNEKEELFARTQPQGIQYGKESVGGSGGKQNNPFDAYLIEKERKQIDERLVEARSILEDRARILKIKELELKASNQAFDRVYLYKYIENKRAKRIARLINYSEAQVYRIIGYIRKSLDELDKK